MSTFSIPHFPGMTRALVTGILICIFLVIEWVGREEQYAIARIGLKFNRPIRWAIYYCLLIIIFYYSGEKQEFIYFQF